MAQDYNITNKESPRFMRNLYKKSGLKKILTTAAFVGALGAASLSYANNNANTNNNAYSTTTQNNSYVYSIPGDKTWEYKGQPNKWETKKVNERTWISINNKTLSNEKYQEANKKLNTLFNQRKLKQKYIIQENTRNSEKSLEQNQITPSQNHLSGDKIWIYSKIGDKKIRKTNGWQPLEKLTLKNKTDQYFTEAMNRIKKYLPNPEKWKTGEIHKSKGTGIHWEYKKNKEEKIFAQGYEFYNWGDNKTINSEKIVKKTQKPQKQTPTQNVEKTSHKEKTKSQGYKAEKEEGIETKKSQRYQIIADFEDSKFTNVKVGDRVTLEGKVLGLPQGFDKSKIRRKWSYSEISGINLVENKTLNEGDTLEFKKKNHAIITYSVEADLNNNGKIEKNEKAKKEKWFTIGAKSNYNSAQIINSGQKTKKTQESQNQTSTHGVEKEKKKTLGLYETYTRKTSPNFDKNGNFIGISIKSIGETYKDNLDETIQGIRSFKEIGYSNTKERLNKIGNRWKHIWIPENVKKSNKEDNILIRTPGVIWRFGKASVGSVTGLAGILTGGITDSIINTGTGIVKDTFETLGETGSTILGVTVSNPIKYIEKNKENSGETPISTKVESIIEMSKNVFVNGAQLQPLNASDITLDGKYKKGFVGASAELISGILTWQEILDIINQNNGSDSLGFKHNQGVLGGVKSEGPAGGFIGGNSGGM